MSFIRRKTINLLTSVFRFNFGRCNQIYSSFNYLSVPKQQFHSSPLFFNGEYEWQDPKNEDEVVNVIFVDKDNTKKYIRAKIGDNIMFLAQRYDIEIEGACEGNLACSTCHCYVEGDYISKLPPPEDIEEDLLDHAPFLKENSRLGCQIVLKKEYDGIEIHLPKATVNFYVDGHKPKPH